MSTFGDFMIGQAVEKDQYIDKLRDERNLYREAFSASLRWLQSDTHKDAHSDQSLEGQGYDDSYLMDMATIRRARRKAEGK